MATKISIKKGDVVSILMYNSKGFLHTKTAASIADSDDKYYYSEGAGSDTDIIPDGIVEGVIQEVDESFVSGVGSIRASDGKIYTEMP